MTLSLKGRFSYITKYNKLVFVYIDPNSRLKLEALSTRSSYDEYDAITLRTPFDRSGFTINMPKGAPIDDTIQSLVGLECEVEVKVSRYNFTSKHQRNAGERMSGLTLTLTDIKRV